MWLEQDAEEAQYSEYLELDLSTVKPSIAGPKRPQDRILLSESKSTFRQQLPDYNDAGDETFEPVRAAKSESVSYNESGPRTASPQPRVPKAAPPSRSSSNPRRAASTPSTTAPSPSRRSPPAPTPRTPLS